MPEFFETSVFFGVFISLISYGIGTLLNKKLKLAVFNPLLIAVIIIIAVLVLLDIDYETYNEGAKYISYLLTRQQSVWRYLFMNSSNFSKSIIKR